MMYKHIMIVFGLVSFSLTAHADLPLTVDDLLADKNRFKLDTDLSYYNHHKSSTTRRVKNVHLFKTP